MTHTIEVLVEQLAERFVKTSKKLVIAESCTGGGLSENLTRFPGSSSWFDCAFVTYSNRSKQDLLSVSADKIEEFGAVSEEIALEMAQGALRKSSADYSVSITGIAGPDGGTNEKPVGTVCIAWCERNQNATTTRTEFSGNRSRIREQACMLAMQGLLDILQKASD
ncbi:MAG: damage-inducible protein CinA [Legionellales bacterium]|nr:damage-inducible protein CinA [Legionellales bacterium]|tara:strand:- start:693 stop:1190 length:498 start_codon:yes stop_codon:yes gene_type:complete